MSIIQKRALMEAEVRWKQGLLADFSVADEQTSMRIASDLIAAKTAERNNLVRQDLRSAEADLDLAKSMVMLEKVNGSNAEARKASLDKELATDSAYVIALGKVQNIKLQIDNLDTEIQHQRDIYLANRYAVEHKTAMLKVLAL